MAIPDASIDPRILESAKQIFLEKGYSSAQLKDICDKAGVTTGALYKRYKGKEDLFCALVREAVGDIETVAKEREKYNPKYFSDEELFKAWEMSESTEYSWSMKEWFDFLYARKEEFTLLLTCAEGTRYSGFIGQWVDRMTEGTYRYIQETEKRRMIDYPITKKELKVLLTAFWTLVYEPFLEGFQKEELDIHGKLVCEMFNWKKILGLHMPG